MDSMSFIVGVKLSAALAALTPALEIMTTLAAAAMLESTSNPRIGLFMMPPLLCMGINGTSAYQNFNGAPTLTSRRGAMDNHHRVRPCAPSTPNDHHVNRFALAVLRST
jgi:hypothetical protein